MQIWWIRQFAGTHGAIHVDCPSGLWLEAASSQNIDERSLQEISFPFTRQELRFVCTDWSGCWLFLGHANVSPRCLDSFHRVSCSSFSSGWSEYFVPCASEMLFIVKLWNTEYFCSQSVNRNWFKCILLCRLFVNCFIYHSFQSTENTKHINGILTFVWITLLVSVSLKCHSVGMIETLASSSLSPYFLKNDTVTYKWQRFHGLFSYSCKSEAQDEAPQTGSGVVVYQSSCAASVPVAPILHHIKLGPAAACLAPLKANQSLPLSKSKMNS